VHYELLSRDVKIDQKTKIFESEKFKIYWEGFLFIKGYAPGKESLDLLFIAIKETTLNNALSLLSGFFAAVIYDKINNTLFSFSDNSGHYNLFKTNDYVSTSFLDLIKISKLTPSEMNPKSLVNFILSQSFIGWKTAFPQIVKIKHNEIIVDNGKEISIENKILEDIFMLKDFDNKSIIQRFSVFIDTLKQVNGKIILDLTGGLDSRMISVIFQNFGLDFETAISGMPGYPDCELSSQIAEIEGISHNVFYQNLNESSIQKELDEEFREFDGVLDIFAQHRAFQFQRYKKDLNCVLNITGHSGEFYKPMFLWSYADPDPKIAINNLIAKGGGHRYGMKFSGIPHSIFSGKYKLLTESYKTRLESEFLNLYGTDSSEKTLAKIYYYYMECGRTSFPFLIDRFSPLMDPHIIPCGTTLRGGVHNNKINKLKRLFFRPWNDRFLYERKVTTSLNRRVAKVNIADALDYTASSSMYQQMKGFTKHAISKGRKNRNKVSKNHPEFFPIVRSLDSTDQMVELLKREDILKTSAKLEEIPDVYLGALYTIGKIIEFCN